MSPKQIPTPELSGLTCLHEVSLQRVLGVVKDLVSDLGEQLQVAVEQRLLSARRTVVVTVGLLDPEVDEEAQRVRRQVEREHEEVKAVVVVQQVDTQPRVVELFAFGP